MDTDPNDPTPAIKAMTREQLEQIAVRAHEADMVVDDWLGSASTRQAATDCLWRLRKSLEAAGLRRGYRMGGNWSPLQWRGSVCQSLSDAGFGISDEEPPRVRQLKSPWDPSGLALDEILKETSQSFEEYFEGIGGMQANHFGLIDPKTECDEWTVDRIPSYRQHRMKEALRLAFEAGLRSGKEESNV